MQNLIDKYLANYAEPEVKAVTALLPSLQANSYYEASLIIPAYDEDPDFLIDILKHPNIQNILLVLVVNAPETVSNFQDHLNTKNIVLWRFIEDNTKLICRRKNLFLFQHPNTHLLCVDRFTESKIPEKQGVGLARKIASDISIACFRDNLLKTPWVFSTDADAHLPDNYFDAISNKPTEAALVFNFSHIHGNSQAVFQATQRYEQALKYYRNALRYAGSPYAFYTLGSTLAFHSEAYCQVRGFPKRAGGEDFYLLNKLAKVGTVRNEDKVEIKIIARGSHRVPFGTGPAVDNILSQEAKGECYRYYHPLIFEELKNWLNFIRDLWQHKEDVNKLPWPSEKIHATMESLSFNRFLNHAGKQCKQENTFIKAFNDWFDGFLTLKFVHYMQSHYYPAQPLEDCLQLASSKGIN